MADAPRSSDAQPAPRGPLSIKGELRRTRIMDAAEAIFAERGYYGCSLRDVAARAESNLGLLNYYFRSKEDLFHEILDRRSGYLHDRIRDSIAERPRPADGRRALEELVRAFIGPFLSICVGSDPGLRNYIRLTSNFMSSYRDPELQGWLTKLQPISKLLIDELRVMMPTLDERSLFAGIYILEAALIFMVQDPGFIDDLTEGTHAATRIDEMIDYVAKFFAAGIAVLPSKTGSGPERE